MTHNFSESVIQWQMNHMDVFEFDENGDCVVREPTREDAIAVLIEIEAEGNSK